MRIYNIISRIGLLLLSISSLVYASLFVEENQNSIDFYYWTALFSIILSIDFTFYCVYSINIKIYNHRNFIPFNKTRYYVLILEVFNYLNRTELYIFLASYFILLLRVAAQTILASANTSYFLLLFLNYSTHLIAFAFLLFSLKNIIKKTNYNKNVRNIQVYFNFTIILIIVLVNNFQSLEWLLFYYPFTGGFYIDLEPSKLGVVSFVSVIIIIVASLLVVNKKFKEWPVT